jgi:thiol-disulfide isomerase/thioredoxin
MKTNKLLVAAVLATASGAPNVAFVEELSVPQSTTSPEVRAPSPHDFPTARIPNQPELASLERAGEWLNSQPLSAADLRGKVILVDFWTYTCINWRRTLPYLRAWAHKYGSQGLVVIGVHTPEFSFEKDIGNVRRAAKDEDVDYPIAMDSDYTIWNAFKNQYWPALYFVDAQGRIRHHQFGEGDYEQSEAIIQQLLAEAGHSSFERQPVSIAEHGAEAGADWKSLRSPETYVGYALAERFASPGGELLDQPRVYAAPARMQLNEWALAGDWTTKKEFAVLNKANGKITYRFHARDVHLVMGPAASGASVRFRVSIDGQPPGASHGVDVNDEGHGTADVPRMYQLIRQPAPIADRQFEIEFLDPGAEVFVFTFG